MLVKIIIADDHPIFRQGLKAVIETDPSFVIIGEAQNGQQAIDLVEKLDPHIVILDVDMPEKDGVEAAKHISMSKKDVKLCFLTLHKDLQILNAMKLLNVDGYLLKDDAGEEIIECLKKILNGIPYVSPHILRSVLNSEPKDVTGRRDKNVLATLTPAEHRIIKLIADTKTNKEIAQELFISVRTVENHRFNICTKLELRGNHSLIRFAVANKRLFDSIE